MDSRGQKSDVSAAWVISTRKSIGGPAHKQDAGEAVADAGHVDDEVHDKCFDCRVAEEHERK